MSGHHGLPRRIPRQHMFRGSMPAKSCWWKRQCCFYTTENLCRNALTMLPYHEPFVAKSYWRTSTGRRVSKMGCRSRYLRNTCTWAEGCLLSPWGMSFFTRQSSARQVNINITSGGHEIFKVLGAVFRDLRDISLPDLDNAMERRTLKKL